MVRRAPRSRTRRSRYMNTARRYARPVASIGGGLAVVNAVGHVLATPNGAGVLGDIQSAIKGQTNWGTPVQGVIKNMKLAAVPIVGGFALVLLGNAAAKAFGVNTKVARLGKYDVRVV